MIKDFDKRVRDPVTEHESVAFVLDLLIQINLPLYANQFLLLGSYLSPIWL